MCGICLRVRSVMSRHSLFVVGLATAQLLAAPSAFAQTYPDHDWTHGSTLQLFGGAAMAPSSDTHPTLGAGLGWEINRWVSIEGIGAWLVARHDNEAFAAEMTAVANLTHPRTIVPYLGAGVGMYVASFDSGSGAMPPFY